MKLVAVALFAAVVHPAVLAQTRQISGVVRDEHGTGAAGVRVSAERIDIGDVTAGATVVDTSGSGGAFTLEVAAGVHALTADPHPPRGLTRTRVDVRNASASAIELRLAAGPVPFVRDDPPRAPLIHAGTPDANGITHITGAAGAAGGGNYVIAIAMRSGLIATTEAAADGSFSVSLRAPHGTWVMLKQDPIGTTYNRIRSEVAHGGEGTAAPLAGTMIRVGDPPAASGVPFGDEGDVNFHPWRVEGTIDKTTLQPGERLTAKVRLIVESPALDGLEKIPMTAHFLLERLSGSGLLGPRAHSMFASNLMTPTGFPIEKNPQYDEATSGFRAFDIMKVAAGRAEGSFEISLTAHAAYPPGHYRAALRFYFEQQLPPAQPRPDLTFDKNSRQPRNKAYLPLVVLGDPPAPRMPLLLLTEHVGNATQGARAEEDYAAFGLASRIALHSDTLVVPRTDSVTGAPIAYRLEPHVPWLSVGDRGVPPDPPIVPLRFPSGSLTVRIEKPNGAVDMIGPAPFVQARTNSIVDRMGRVLSPVGGSVSEPYQLSTMDPRFEVAFAEEGRHRIRVEMTIDDERGVAWSGSGTYDVFVARPLWIDSNTLPGTPFHTGDRLALGGTLYPPLAADVTVRVRFAPSSDLARLVDRTYRARSNRFGTFTPVDAFTFSEPGEYRVDVFAATDDHAWAGTRSWGGVVAPVTERVIAHGQRGIDDLLQPRPQWFFRSQTTSTRGPSHVFMPFHGGDVAWLERQDSVQPTLTFQDPDGSVSAKMKPSLSRMSGFDFGAQFGEAPLWIGRKDGHDPHIEPARNDLWAYSYRSVQRPFVRVREEISDAPCNGCYWRFDEQYAAQAGIGRNGDLPNDFKFQFGGVVIRGSAIGEPVYATYASLFVLVPGLEQGGEGSRTFPPFQGNSGGPSGGPLFTLKGKEIDLFFHPTGLRPGAIVQSGEQISFAGYSAPTLPSKAEVTVTSPSGVARTIAAQANKIGWFHPAQHLTVVEPGVWKAKVKILFDGTTSAGKVVQPFPTGDVLGSREGEFSFYVVDSRTPPLGVDPLPRFVRPAAGPLTFRVQPPAGLSDVQLAYTVTMPGFILEEGTTSAMQYVYDATKLASDFPNLDLIDPNGFTGADTITISLLLSGTDSAGARRHFARRIVLQGEEVQMPEQTAEPRRRTVRK